MKKTNQANFSKPYSVSTVAQKKGAAVPGAAIVKVAKKGIGMSKRGKAGLAMAGLAAAGGLGIAGAKAIGNARKPKSLTDRLKNASKKMFK